VDLLERAGELKGMLVDFAISPRFDSELTAVIWQNFPDGVVDDEAGFTVTRDGHRIGELIPLRRRRRFVPRQEFAAMSRNAPSIDIETFRADQEAAIDHEADSRPTCVNMIGSAGGLPSGRAA
jgi:hypothetical protein